VLNINNLFEVLKQVVLVFLSRVEVGVEVVGGLHVGDLEEVFVHCPLEVVVSVVLDLVFRLGAVGIAFLDDGHGFLILLLEFDFVGLVLEHDGVEQLLVVAFSDFDHGDFGQEVLELLDVGEEQDADPDVVNNLLVLA